MTAEKHILKIYFFIFFLLRQSSLLIIPVIRLKKNFDDEIFFFFGWDFVFFCFWVPNFVILFSILGALLAILGPTEHPDEILG